MLKFYPALLAIVLTGLYLEEGQPSVRRSPLPEAQTTEHRMLSKADEPPPRGAPTGRKPFGTRGPCEASDRPFTPLLPPPNPNFSGNTLAERPTFWFYIPYAPGRVRGGEFGLRDRTNKLVYAAEVGLPSTPGFVHLKLPQTAPVLQVNQPYTWELTLYCATETRADSIDLVRHSGQITRINRPELISQLPQATVEKRLQLYTIHKLWYDAAAMLDSIAPTHPGWIATLKQLDLESLKQEAIVGSITIRSEQASQ